MLTVKQNLIAVAATVLGSLLFMAGLNRVWPWEKRRAHNDVIGWHLSILGTTYAVILGFMLYAVWTSFGEAALNVDLEANAVVDINRLADALPEPQRTELQTLTRSYTDAVINQGERARSRRKAARSMTRCGKRYFQLRRHCQWRSMLKGTRCRN